jgi:hypothetical protein
VERAHYADHFLARAGEDGEARLLVIAGEGVVLVDEQFGRALEDVARADYFGELVGERRHGSNLAQIQ